MKKYADIVGLNGAKTPRVVFREDEEKRLYALKDAVNMLITKAGSIATRFSTDYETTVDIDQAELMTPMVITTDLDGVVVVVVGPSNSSLASVWTTLGNRGDYAVGTTFFGLATAGLDFGDEGRLFTWRARDFVRTVLYRHEAIPAGEGYPVLDMADNKMDWRSAFYDGDAVDQCPLLAGDSLEWTIGEFLKEADSFAIAASGSDFELNARKTRWHADYPIAESDIAGMYIYMCIYHAGDYDKWMWWTGYVESVDESADPEFVITLSGVESCFIHDETGSVPATPDLDEVWQDPSSNPVCFIFSPCPVLHQQPNYMFNFQDRIILCYDSWLVGTTIGAGFAFDTRGLDDQSFALHLRDEYGKLYWAAGVTDVLLGTSTGVYKLNIAGGLSATTIEDVSRQSSTPCADKEPAWLGDYVCFVSADKRHVFQAKYSSTEEQYITECLNSDYDIPENTMIQKIASHHGDRNYLFCLLTNGTVVAYAVSPDQKSMGWGQVLFYGIVTDLLPCVETGEFYFALRDNVYIHFANIRDPFEEEFRLNYNYYDSSGVIKAPVDGIDVTTFYKDDELGLDMVKVFSANPSYGLMSIVDYAAPPLGETIDVTFPYAVGCVEGDIIIANDSSQNGHPGAYRKVFYLKNVTDNDPVWECDLYEEDGTTPVQFAAGDNWPANLTMVETEGGELSYLDDVAGQSYNAAIDEHVVGYYRRNLDEDWIEDTGIVAISLNGDGTVDTSHYGRDYLVGIAMPKPHIITMRPPSFAFDRIRTVSMDVGLFRTGALEVGEDEDNLLTIELNDDINDDTAPNFYTGVRRIRHEDRHERSGEVYLGQPGGRRLEITGIRFHTVGEEDK